MHTGDSYDDDELVRKYVAVHDTKSYYVHYERPAVLSMLPPLEGLDVLDAACGPGWYTEHLLKEGANVTACDLNHRFVEITRKRVQSRATMRQADLTKPLTFAKDSSFDLVLCTLALHYLEDWVPTLREFHRVLKPGGALVFSTHHPTMTWKLFELPDYFATVEVEDHWPDIGDVRYYHRPLTAIFEALHAGGFVVDGLLEPRALEGFSDVETRDRLRTNPWFLVMHSVKH